MPPSSTARTTCSRKRVRTAGQAFRDVGLDVSFRSTAPVLALVDAVFADPLAPPGRRRGRRDAGPLRRPRRACRHGRILAAGAAAGRRRRRRPGRCRTATRPDLRPADAWPTRWRSGSRADRRLGACWRASGRPLAPGDVLILVRRRDAFARALVRALKTRGVPVAGLDRTGADRPAGGAGPDGAGGRAAAALGRPDLRLPADQPARRPDRRRLDGRWRSAAPARCGTRCATAPRERPAWQRAGGVLRGVAGARRLRLALCPVRRGAGSARRPGAAVRPARAGGGGTGRRTAERRAGLRRAASAVAAGLPALAAPVRRGGEARDRGGRQPGADHDGARRQGLAGAAGDRARHLRAAER